jgi:hypothetical protein
MMAPSGSAPGPPGTGERAEGSEPRAEGRTQPGGLTMTGESTARIGRRAMLAAGLASVIGTVAGTLGAPRRVAAGDGDDLVIGKVANVGQSTTWLHTSNQDGFHSKTDGGDALVGECAKAGKSGVFGLNTNPGGYGVYGSNNVAGNWGSLGSADRGVTGASGPGEGVRGQSNTGDGVAGQSGGANKAGVFGYNTNAAGTGVFGRHDSSGNWGALGSADQGVKGYAKGGTGVLGESSSPGGWGVYGRHLPSGNWGALGRAAGGIHGGSTSGEGVRGQSDKGDGVVGMSSGAGKSGVYAFNYNKDGYGAYGENLAASTIGFLGGKQHGVFGQAGGAAQVAVVGEHTGQGWGVAGTNKTTKCEGRLGGFTGVMATADPSSLALLVLGRVMLGLSGVLTVPAGKSAASQDLTAGWVKPASVVHATIQTNRAGLFVQAAVANPAKGTVTVYLKKKVSAATRVAWFILENAPL